MQNGREVTKVIPNRTGLESPPIASDRLVGKRMNSSGRFQSSAGLVEPSVKQGSPLPKAKYYLATDSAKVGRLKDEKNPREGSEIEPETVYLQTCRSTMPRKGNVRRRALCIMIPRVALRSKVNPFRGEAVAKASVNSARPP